MAINLEQQFNQIREDQVEFDRSQLPDEVKLPTDENFSSQELLNLATAFWQRIFQPADFLVTLKTYLELPEDQYQKATQEKQYLKKVRKAGLIYKSAYRFGDARRNLPETFDNFLVKLGQLNDHFYQPTGQGLAKEILEMVGDHDLSQPDSQVKPAESRELEARIDWIVKRCQVFLSEAELQVKDFHKLRKLLRHVMNLYQLAAVAKIDDLNIRQTFQYICDLNSALGDEHDEVVKKDIAGIIAYEDERIPLDEGLKTKINNLVQKLDQALIKSRLSHIG